jgi:transaldolase
MKNIQTYLDGPRLTEIKKYRKKVDGFTFNPSLFKKLGAKDYIDFSKKIVKNCKNKPVSLEVIADDEKNCIRQAEILSKLGKNVYVKIPIMFTNGKTTKNVILKLVKKKIKLNITAIFSLKQIKEIIIIIKNTETILSIFSGRIYDIGIDAEETFREISKYVVKNSNCKTLWASCRMTFDYHVAKRAGANIITMPQTFIEKLKLNKIKPMKYSQLTVKSFYDDAKKSKFKF